MIANLTLKCTQDWSDDNLEAFIRAPNAAYLEPCCSQHASVRDYAILLALQNGETSINQAILLKRLFALHRLVLSTWNYMICLC